MGQSVYIAAEPKVMKQASMGNQAETGRNTEELLTGDNCRYVSESECIEESQLAGVVIADNVRITSVSPVVGQGVSVPAQEGFRNFPINSAGVCNDSTADFGPFSQVNSPKINDNQFAELNVIKFKSELQNGVEDVVNNLPHATGNHERAGTMQPSCDCNHSRTKESPCVRECDHKKSSTRSESSSSLFQQQQRLQEKSNLTDGDPSEFGTAIFSDEGRTRCTRSRTSDAVGACLRVTVDMNKLVTDAQNGMVGVVSVQCHTISDRERTATSQSSSDSSHLHHKELTDVSDSNCWGPTRRGSVSVFQHHQRHQEKDNFSSGEAVGSVSICGPSARGSRIVRGSDSEAVEASEGVSTGGGGDVGLVQTSNGGDHRGARGGDSIISRRGGSSVMKGRAHCSTQESASDSATSTTSHKVAASSRGVAARAWQWRG